MKKPAPTLAHAMAKKPAAATPEPAPARDNGRTVTLTLRLPAGAHDVLRELAFVTRRSQHNLLLEAMNLLFERHGKPPIAS